MKTIKERAEDFANENWTLDEANFACEDGYIKGATELIDKACEWLRTELKKMEEKHCIHVHGFDDERREQFLERFVKEMEGE